jgi:hypothetical protein
MKTQELTEKNEANGSFPGENDLPLTQDQCMLALSQTIKTLDTRLNGKQFKAQSSDKAKLEHVKALVGILKIYIGLLRDSQIIDMKIRISDLEASMRDADDKN